MVVFADFFHNLLSTQRQIYKRLCQSVHQSVHPSVPNIFQLDLAIYRISSGQILAMLLFINAAQQSWAKRNRYFSNMLLSTEIFSKRRKICAIWRETWGDFTYYLQNAIDRVKFCQIWAFTVPVMYIFFQTKKQDSFGHFLIVVAVSLLKFSMKKRIKWRKVCVLEISTINYSGNYNMQMRLFHKRNQYFILEIWHNLRELHFNQSSVSGVMVSIVAFQAVDRGSIPCCRIFF